MTVVVEEEGSLTLLVVPLQAMKEVEVLPLPLAMMSPRAVLRVLMTTTIIFPLEVEVEEAAVVATTMMTHYREDVQDRLTTRRRRRGVGVGMNTELPAASPLPLTRVLVLQWKEVDLQVL